MKNRIYLDYNASTPLRPESRAAILSALDVPERSAHNASSVHSFGRAGRKIVEDARAQIAALVNAPSAQIVFNSGATESNNTIIRHFETQFPEEAILVSAIEHPSILESSSRLEKIPVDSRGQVDAGWLETRLGKTPKVSLVSVMMANNETGAIQDVPEIAKIAHRHGALFHCDAAQALGRISIDLTNSSIDFLSFSSHKIGGPQGVGALVTTLCGQTPVLLRGGGQEKGARAGTENVAGIAGFGAAAKAAMENMDASARLAALRDHMEARLLEISPELVIHAKDAPRLPGTSFFSLPGVKSETMMMALDLEGIALSNGSACSSGRVKASHVLRAMGADESAATSALRISGGWATTQSDIDGFLDIWETLYKRWKKK